MLPVTWDSTIMMETTLYLVWERLALVLGWDSRYG